MMPSYSKTNQLYFFLKKLIIHATLISILTILLYSTSILAQKQNSSQNLIKKNTIVTKPNSCSPNFIFQPKNINTNFEVKAIEAKKVSSIESDILQLEGEVTLEDSQTYIESDTAIYNKTKKIINLRHGVKITSAKLLFASDAVEYKQGFSLTTKDLQFQFRNNNSYGSSSSLSYNKELQLSKLTNIKYTLCKTNNVFWSLNASTMNIDDNNNVIYGKHAFVNIYKVPVFYMPYYRFVFAGRASGFLVPKIGNYKSLNKLMQNSYVRIPYYFNLAPNYDLTMTLSNYSDQEMSLDNQIRILTNKSNTIIYLGTSLNSSSSETINFNSYKGQRYRGKIIHTQSLGKSWNMTIDSNLVSDDYFYTDTNIDKRYSNATLLENSFNLNYQFSSFKANLRHKDYKPLLGNKDIYGVEPELHLEYHKNLSNLSFSIKNLTSNFTSNNKNLIKAKRNVLIANTSLNLKHKAYFKNKNNLTLINRNYKFAEEINVNDFNQTQSDFNNLIFTSNHKLIFEKELDSQFTQTIIPQIQFSYVNLANQKNLPSFDSSPLSLNFNNLLNPLKYTGYDKIFSTKQISYALNSQTLYNQMEIFNVGIGQNYYIEPAKLYENLEQNEAEFSDIFLQLNLESNSFYAHEIKLDNTARLDKDTFDNKGSFNRVIVKNPYYSLIALHNRNLVDQNTQSTNTVIAEQFLWGGYAKLFQSWNLGYFSKDDISKTDASSPDNEQIFAVKYESCCYSFEIFTSQVSASANNKNLKSDSINLLLELKGLTNIGTSFIDFIKEKMGIEL